MLIYISGVASAWELFPCRMPCAAAQQPDMVDGIMALAFHRGHDAVADLHYTSALKFAHH